MKALFRIMLLALVVSLASVIYLVVRSSRSRTDLLATEVSADSSAAYQSKADSLETEAHNLRRKLEDAGLLQQPRIQSKLSRLDGEVRSLRVAIGKWETARKGNDQNQAYRECLLLYGRGACGRAIEGDGLLSR